MPFYAYLSKQFDYTHENDFFRKVTLLLKEQYQYSSDTIHFIGNLGCNGSNFDAVLIKNKAIIIIDFKDFGGKIEIPLADDGLWKYINDREHKEVIIKGGSFANPYRQLSRYKELFIDFLKDELKVSYNPRFVVKGIVLFHEKAEFDKSRLNKLKVWFNVCDIESFLNMIEDTVSSKILLSEGEIRKIIQYLEVENFPFPPPTPIKLSPLLIKNTTTSNTNKSLENIEELASCAYKIVKQYYDGKKGLSKKTARKDGEEILQQKGWSKSDAKLVFQPITNLIDGKGFTLFGSPKKVVILEHIITHILNDYKEDGLKSVIISLEETITSGHGSNAMKELINKLNKDLK